jgi:hypothetical protein
MNDRVYCSVRNEDDIKIAINYFDSLANIKFGRIHRGFNCTESETLFSYAASKFQDLIRL